MRRVRTLRGAPAHVKRWWGGTMWPYALFRLVRMGSTWEEAHDRLLRSYQRTWDRYGGRDPQRVLRRLHRRERREMRGY